jgi:hypothetical protein
MTDMVFLYFPCLLLLRDDLQTRLIKAIYLQNMFSLLQCLLSRILPFVDLLYIKRRWSTYAMFIVLNET